MPQRTKPSEFDELMKTLYRVRELKDPDPRILSAIEKRLKEIAQNDTPTKGPRKQEPQRSLLPQDSAED